MYEVLTTDVRVEIMNEWRSIGGPDDESVQNKLPCLARCEINDPDKALLLLYYYIFQDLSGSSQNLLFRLIYNFRLSLPPLPSLT
jgi:hypothetical protein